MHAQILTTEHRWRNEWQVEASVSRQAYQAWQCSSLEGRARYTSTTSTKSRSPCWAASCFSAASSSVILFLHSASRCFFLSTCSTRASGSWTQNTHLFGHSFSFNRERERPTQKEKDIQIETLYTYDRQSAYKRKTAGFCFINHDFIIFILT